MIVARGFRIAGWALGLTCFIAAIGLGVSAFALNHQAQVKPAYLDVGAYGLVGLLSNGANGVAAGLSFLGGVASAILALLAIVAVAGIAFAVLLHAVGRGLTASAAWARVLAGLISLVALLNAASALAFLRQGAAILDAALVASLAYVLWVVGWRFGDPPPGSSRPPAPAPPSGSGSGSSTG